jgi:hypothetical protein
MGCSCPACWSLQYNLTQVALQVGGTWQTASTYNNTILMNSLPTSGLHGQIYVAVYDMQVAQPRCSCCTSTGLLLLWAGCITGCCPDVSAGVFPAIDADWGAFNMEAAAQADQPK